MRTAAELFTRASYPTLALRYAEISYELVTPARRPLPAAGCVKDASELIPAAVLNFRCEGKTCGHGAGRESRGMVFSSNSATFSGMEEYTRRDIYA